MAFLVLKGRQNSSKVLLFLAAYYFDFDQEFLQPLHPPEQYLQIGMFDDLMSWNETLSSSSTTSHRYSSIVQIKTNRFVR
jgi:hypothetical protein